MTRTIRQIRMEAFIAPRLKAYDELRKTLPTVTPIVRKTRLMRLAEQQWGEPVEELLVYGRVRDLAQELNLSRSTVSRWRLQLGIRQRTTKDAQYQNRVILATNH